MFAPYKDRTVSLILEKAYKKRTGGVKDVAQDLLRKYVPSQGRNSGSGGTIGDSLSKFIDLKGPTSITVTHSSGVAQEEGLFTSFIQPWFIKNLQIDIKGSSYLGAYPLLSNPDRDAERVLGLLYTTLNDFSGRLGPSGSKDRVVLLLRGGPKLSQKFVGYVTNLVLSENIESAYLMDYSLTFIGKNLDSSAIENGHKRAYNTLA